MKRGDLLKKLSEQGCSLKRNGGRHDIWHNPKTGKSAPIPRHTEIPDTLCKLIQKQLGLGA
jgi:mRNA interferase HicA